MKGREGRTDGKEEGEERRTEPQNRNHSDRNHQRESKSQSSPETEQHRHGNEITAVERRKKMAKEVGSRGVETKEDERSTKKCDFEAICASR